MPDAVIPPFARALGRVPSGLFLVTTRSDRGPLGFVGSFVMQAGFEPPMVSVAIGTGREHLAAIRASGCFAVSILDKASSPRMGPFLKRRPAGGSPFDEVEHRPAPSGSPVLSDALAWLDCRLAGEHATGDHVVVFGVVQAGELCREDDPSIHVRRDGRGY